MPDVNLEFLGRQLAQVLDGQRQMGARLAAIEEKLAETATREIMLRVLRSFEGQVELADIRTQLLRETLEARLRAAESRLDVLEQA